jgi:3-oxoacyl-[acyl-carrier protein] reductase
MSLDGKNILITGANSDLGIASALEFAKDHADTLFLQYHKNNDKLINIVDRLRDENVNVIMLKGDVSNYNDVLMVKDHIFSKVNRLDAIVMYAGYPAEKDIWYVDPLELSDEMLDKPWSIDLKGSYHYIRAFGKIMKRGGYGSIVLTSSTPAIYGDHIGLAFTLAKAGIIALVRSLAKILAPEVRINAIALGNIATEANLKNYTNEEIINISNNIPLKRFGKPEDIAKSVKFLISDNSSYITGHTLVLDGGELRY